MRELWGCAFIALIVQMISIWIGLDETADDMFWCVVIFIASIGIVKGIREE